ncbi:MAG TPA: acyltransferase [Sphingobium sp.]|nr:acyltransferase [Sphingobium sp.]
MNVSINNMNSDSVVFSRSVGIDFIRILLSILVVLHHTAISYGGSGSWFWREEPNASIDILVIFNTINQSYFMGMFFLIAGYYTPRSYDRKQPAKFLSGRLLRLGLPLLVFFFILHPLTVAIARSNKSNPLMQEWWHMTKACAFGPGPLWFAIALLIFATCYTGGREVFRLADREARSVDALPSHLKLALVAVGLGMLSFLVRLAFPVGKEVLWLQLGYFPCYIFLFVAGCATARPRLLERITLREAAPWLIITSLALVTLPIMLWTRGPMGGFEGGWNLNALYYALWDPLVACGVILGLLVAARRWGRHPTPITSSLARNAFGAFIIHPPVLVALSVWAMPWTAAPLIKFTVVGAAACTVSFILAAALRELPGMRHII